MKKGKGRDCYQSVFVPMFLIGLTKSGSELALWADILYRDNSVV